jgi:hypothetical protein
VQPGYLSRRIANSFARKSGFSLGGGEEIFDFIPTQLRLPSYYLSLPVFGGRSSSLGGDHNRRVQ